MLNLYAVLPGVFAERDLAPLHSLLDEQVTVALENVWDHDHVLTDHAQMQEAMAGRAVIDQAKGIIMHARGCDADTAFAALREVAQRNRKRVVDVARDLVEENTGTRPRRRHTVRNASEQPGNTGR